MTEKEAAEKIKLIPNGVALLKNLFSRVKMEEVKLAEIKLKDGTVIMIEGEKPTVGMTVMVVADGNSIPAPDGEFELEDGSYLVVKGGKIEEIKPKKEEAASGEKTDDFAATVKSLTERIEALEKKNAENEVKMAEANKTINSQKEEMKKQFEIQKETFKIVEVLSELPATKQTEEKDKLALAKHDRIAELSKNLLSLKK